VISVAVGLKSGGGIGFFPCEETYHLTVSRGGVVLASQSELVLTFGLGTQIKADNIEIQWPSGQVDKLSNVDAGQTVTVEEGKGVVSARAYGPPLKSAE
jgi:hypothetical protein